MFQFIKRLSLYKIFLAKYSSLHSGIVSSALMGQINELKYHIKEQNEITEFDLLNKLSTRVGVTEECPLEYEVVVSLTSYGRRLYTVHLVIESLLQQTFKPNKIILWLSEDIKGETPLSLIRLESRGLTIRYTKDIRPYKKLIPALYEYPESIIVTFDDDHIYQSNMLEKLITGYKHHPDSITSGHALILPVDKTKNITKKYDDWEWMLTPEKPDLLTLPIGSNGVLYPPHSLHPDVVREDLFTSLCPITDDMWFKAMSLRVGTKCQVVDLGEDFFHYNSMIQSVQDMGLWHFNVHHGGNDDQLKAVWEYYNLGQYFE